MKTQLFVIKLLLATVHAADDSSFIQCYSNKDCPNSASEHGGMFNGTCCGRNNWVKGDPFKLGPDFAKTAEIENKDPKTGMCNAAATLNFGKLPVGGTKGNDINVGEYLKFNWDNEEWARAYFVQTMGKVPLDQAPKDFNEWAKMIVPDYPAAAHWFDSVFYTTCLEPRMAPQMSGKNELQMCKSMDDCQGPEFEGGCCVRTSITNGRDAFDAQPAEVRQGWEDLEKMPDMGYCAPKKYVDFMNSSENGTNFWDYEQFIWNFAPEMRDLFFKDWPKDAKRTDDFNTWASITSKQWPQIYDWKKIDFEHQCLGGSQWGMDMPNWEDMGINVDTRDDGMTISMEGMSIEMNEGKDGEGSSMRIVMGATKIAASALAIASVALY